MTKYLLIIIFLISAAADAGAQYKIDVRKALVGTIVMGYAVDSLQDGIAFTKSPKGQDLRTLWHSAKYAHIALTLATGALNVISINRYGWKQTLLYDAVGFVIGFLVWKYSYPLWRSVDWPEGA